MDAGIQGIQGIQCNFSVNASVHTDPGNTGQGILGLCTREYKEYRGIQCNFSVNASLHTDPGDTCIPVTPVFPHP